VVGLFALGYLMLSIGWALSNPLPSGPDEAAHYVKALATAEGELVGRHVPFPAVHTGDFPGVMYVWDQSTTEFMLSAQQAPASTFQCLSGNSDAPATCVSGTRCERWGSPCTGDPRVTGEVTLATYVGTYPPTFYVVPGILALLGNSDVDGLGRARIGALLTACLLVALAALMLIDRRRPALSLVGLIVSLTPTAVYLNAVLNPNGGEVASSVCFTAAVLRIARDRGAAPGWVWVIGGAGGALVAFSRAFGPIWVAAPVAAAVLLLGPVTALRAVRAAGRPALVGISLATAGLAADLLWWHVVGVPKSLASPLTFTRYLWLLVGNLPGMFDQQIGLLGWMDIPIGAAAYIVWHIMLLALLILGLLVAGARERAVLLALIGADIAFSVVVGAVFRVTWDWPAGPGAIGRYFLPGSVVITLFAGEILFRNSDRLGSLMPRNLPVYLAVGAGVSQCIALWMAARRFAVGVNGPLLFLAHSKWSPSLGWQPWLALAGLGCLITVASVVLAARTPYVSGSAGNTEFAARTAVEPIAGDRADQGSAQVQAIT
jgi:hypothetical protein